MSGKFRPFALGFIAVMLLTPVYADENDVNTLVITQKRAQSIQDVPISVSAFDSDFIQQFDVTDLKDLVDFTPGFHGKTSNDSFIDYLGIRGITTQDYGVGGDPSIGIYFNNVYQGRNGGVVSTFFDISHVEVVKGPQGTLFGRNAASGAVSIYSNPATDDTEGALTLGIGQDNLLSLEAMYNGTSDDLNYRLALFQETEDNFVTNIAGTSLRDREVSALRATLNYSGFEATDVNLVVGYEDRMMDPGLYRSIWTIAEDDQIASDLGALGLDDAQISSISLDVSHTVNNMEFSSLTAYKASDWRYYEDYDGTANPYGNYFQADDITTLSQEFRLNVSHSERLYWFVGLSFYKEKFDSEFFNEYDEDPFCGILPELEEWEQSLSDYTSAPTPSFANCHELFTQGWYELDPVTDAQEIAALVSDGEIPAPGDGAIGLKERVYARGKNIGYAVYGDLTLKVSDATEIIVGGRYTHDKKEFELNLPDPGGWLGHYWLVGAHTDGQWLANSETWNEFTPRLAVNHSFSDALSGFINYSKGYKAGGHNTFAFNINYQDWTGYDEINDDYTYEPDGIINDIDQGYWVDELYGGVVPEGTMLASYDPEFVDSIELGIKGRSQEGDLKYNVTIYQYDYTDFQGVFPNAGGVVIKNIGEAEGEGIEFDMTWRPSELIELFVSASHQNSNVIDGEGLQDESLAGLKLNAPETSFAIISSVYWTIADQYDAIFRLNHNWQSETYSSEFVGGNDRFAIAGYGVTDVQLSVVIDQHQTIRAYIENVFDKTYYEAGVEDTGLNRFGIGRGRTAGLKYQYVF
jgi:iron complex outermembrane receptor protein